MKKIFIIVTVLTLVGLTANAQKYGFYGNGAAKTQRTYHNGVSGTFIGYHPSGVSNSHVTGSTTSKRSGYSAPTTGYNQKVSNRSNDSKATPSTRFGATINASPEQMAYTTSSNQVEATIDDKNNSKESDDANGPIGDAILPLLLLLIPIVVLKVRKH